MINSLDEAIKGFESAAEDYERGLKVYENMGEERLLFKEEENECKEYAKEHRQLAEWLRELKKYRFIFEKVGKILADNGYTMDDLDTIFGKANDEEVNADEGNSN